MFRFHHSNSLTKKKGKESQEAEEKKIKPQQTENTLQPKEHTEAAGTLWTLAHPYGCFTFNPGPSFI